MCRIYVVYIFRWHFLTITFSTVVQLRIHLLYCWLIPSFLSFFSALFFNLSVISSIRLSSLISYHYIIYAGTWHAVLQAVCLCVCVWGHILAIFNELLRYCCFKVFFILEKEKTGIKAGCREEEEMESPYAHYMPLNCCVFLKWL